jgi:pectinesterase
MQRSALLIVSAIFASCVMVPQLALAKDLTVAADGSGDFKTVQEAVDAVPPKGQKWVVIKVKPGTYKERIKIGKDKPFIEIRGEAPKTTVLTWNWNASTIGPEGKGVGTFGSYTMSVEADDFIVRNVTIENAVGDTGQAVALSANGERHIYDNCRLLGWQDTLFAGRGRHYYAGCYIEGRVDFIFGGATAVFEKCELHSKNGGYVTAASTPKGQPYGYVFINCKLTGDPAPFNPATVDPFTTKRPGKPGKLTLLGRPWRADANVTFINCFMEDHILPEGWSNWSRPENEKTARYAEYGSTGPGGDTSQRVPWSRQLTREEAEKITVQSVLAGNDGWKPVVARVEFPEGYQPPPEPAKGSLVVLAAKDAQIKGSNARLEDGANIGFWTNIDTYFEWKADLLPGKYRVAVTHAQKDPGTEIEVTVGMDSFRATPPVTGGFGNFESVVVGEVTIKQGGAVPITLRALSKPSDFIMNVTEIVFTKTKE